MPDALRRTASKCHDGVANFINSLGKGSPWPFCTSGSISPRTFSRVHGVDDAGKPVMIKLGVRRAELVELIAKLQACVIGMEACSGGHHWAREFGKFGKFGHTVRLMAPKFVAPYRMSGKRGKNDAADAAAICEAVQRLRPNMRFVPVKTEAAQARLLSPTAVMEPSMFGVMEPARGG